MHATPVKAPPESPRWIHELKYDGFRVLASRSGRHVRLCSSTGRDIARSFPEIVADMLAIGRDFTIDGDLVICDRRGHPQFERLRQRALMAETIDVTYAAIESPASILAFDLLELDGVDYRQRPLLERKRQLARILRGRERVRCAGYQQNGAALLAEARRLEIEGIVAKRVNSVYTAGRSQDWRTISIRRAAHERRTV
jgi:bifunctional non-homologous end joining protein LigD